MFDWKKLARDLNLDPKGSAFTSLQSRLLGIWEIWTGDDILITSSPELVKAEQRLYDTGMMIGFKWKD